MEESKEIINVADNTALLANAPWFGSTADLREYIKIVSACFASVNSSNNVREIVLETWLILDYFVRMILAKLWRLDDFKNDEHDFDLQAELLPGLEGCLRLLERILVIQRSLDEDPRANMIELPAEFLFFLNDNHPDFVKRLSELQEEYYQKHYPDLSEQKGQEAAMYSSEPLVFSETRRYCVNKKWVEALSSLDDAWFKSARRLNKARNKAAHSHDPDQILRAFGCAGAKSAELTKQECLQLINKLVGIVKRSANQVAKQGDRK
jgi:hypothetical protein